MADTELLKKKITLADFLKQQRAAAGLSQGDVADKFGYSTPQFISNWERGVSRPPINVLKKIGELYKISAEDLFEVVLSETIFEITRDFRNKFGKSKK
jgi:transcriptional regulator with XRE-family HTH domain